MKLETIQRPRDLRCFTYNRRASYGRSRRRRRLRFGAFPGDGPLGGALGALAVRAVGRRRRGPRRGRLDRAPAEHHPRAETGQAARHEQGTTAGSAKGRFIQTVFYPDKYLIVFLVFWIIYEPWRVYCPRTVMISDKSNTIASIDNCLLHGYSI